MEIRPEKVAVVGIGYVGLPVACMFASKGFRTVGLDISQDRVDMINRGVCPIGGEEPGLKELMERMVSTDMLTASVDYSSIQDADLIAVCVDTPVDDGKKPVLRSIIASVTSIGRNMKKGATVSIESTIPPGTMMGTVIPILEKESGMRAGSDFHVLHCPERVMPGRLLANLREYKRVLGGIDEASIRKGMYFYSSYVESEILPTDLICAEISKTGENAYRDVQIAFANEMALICERLGADVFKVRELINSSPFRDMHIPGSGVGGYCLPKDSWLLVSNAREEADLIVRARAVNEKMPHHLVDLFKDAMVELDEGEGKRKVAIMGIAFLRDSDDTRNTPAAVVIESLKDDFDLVAHDPYVKEFLGMDIEEDSYVAMKDCDAAIFVTDHSEYRDIDFNRMRMSLRNPVIIDGRNLFDAHECRQAGFIYRAIGKGNRVKD